MELRDYQVEAVAAAMRDLGELGRSLLVLPTGAGKTVTFCHVARERGGRTLVLAHRDDLLRQASAHLAEVVGCEVGFYSGQEKGGLDAPVVLGSVAALCRRRDLGPLGEFGTVIIDETHHAVAASYQKVINMAKGADVLGVTATPNRADKVGLGVLFPKLSYEIKILELIRRGFLVPPVAWRVEVDGLDTTTIRTRAGDLGASDVAAAMHDALAADVVVDRYRELADGRPAILFAATVDSAEEFAASFNAAGIVAEVVTGETAPDERRAIYARSKAGQTSVICNVSVMTEGTDLPWISAVIIARSTKSPGLMTQMIGRGLRTFPGKVDCVVLDVTGATRDARLATPVDLIGRTLDASIVKPGMSLVEIEEAYEAAEAAERRSPAGYRARTRVELVDLFGEAALKRPPVVWNITSNGYPFVSLGHYALFMTSAGSVGWISREGRGIGWLADGLSVENARAMIEGVATTAADLPRPISPMARWRREPAGAGVAQDMADAIQFGQRITEESNGA